MISIYGDESSSAEFATYGLLAISDADLPALAIAVKRAKALLKSNGDEPLPFESSLPQWAQRKIFI